ncbi:unnamed protein product, partial [Polarella glacialis]
NRKVRLHIQELSDEEGLQVPFMDLIKQISKANQLVRPPHVLPTGKADKNVSMDYRVQLVDWKQAPVAGRELSRQ